MKRILIFIFVAILILTPLDALQIVAGVRTLGTNPWLTPLKFGLVGAVLGLLSFALDPKPHPAKSLAVIFHGIIFVEGYIGTTIYSTTWQILLFLILLVINQDIVSKYLFKVSSLEVLPFALTLGVIGPTLEYLDVKSGGFSYTSSPGTIPFWLPMLWLSGAFFTRSLVGRETKKPKPYKWLGRLITFIAPAAQVVAGVWYALTPVNIKRLGLIGSFKMAWQVYGLRKNG